jgi:hypothetical protein
MPEPDWLAERFEETRGHLRAVAYRMLGSLSEADDAVQESWLRLSRSDIGGVENLAGWLTTVGARVCLDMLRSRTSRREESMGTQREVRGASAVAKLGFSFSGDGWSAQPTLVNGAAGVVVTRGGRAFSVIGFTVRRGKIAAIDILADPARLRRLGLAVLND